MYQMFSSTNDIDANFNDSGGDKAFPAWPLVLTYKMT